MEIRTSTCGLHGELTHSVCSRSEHKHTTENVIVNRDEYAKWKNTNHETGRHNAGLGKSGDAFLGMSVFT